MELRRRDALAGRGPGAIHAINAYNATPGNIPVTKDVMGTLSRIPPGHNRCNGNAAGSPVLRRGCYGLNAVPRRMARGPDDHPAMVCRPVVNVAGVDRGLGIIFTHDHYGPSPPADRPLRHGVGPSRGLEVAPQRVRQQLGYDPVTGIPARTATSRKPSHRALPDQRRGPTSWQAAICRRRRLRSVTSTVKSETLEPYREFYFEFSDFQHAYEAGVYVGAGQNGLPLAGTGPVKTLWRSTPGTRPSTARRTMPSGSP